MFLFKKKNEKKQANIIDMNDQRILDLPKVTSQSVLNHPMYSKTLPKLVLWLNNHPETIPHLSFRTMNTKMFPNDVIFREDVIKTQIYHCIKLSMRLEEAIRDGPSKVEANLKHPCQELNNMPSINILWKKVLIYQSIIDDFNKEIYHYCWEETKRIECTVAYCSSLISSVDALPKNFIPIIDFSRLDINNEVIASLNNESFRLVKVVSILESKQNALIEKIRTIKARYTDPEITKDMILSSILKRPIDQRLALFDDFLEYCGTKINCVKNYHKNPTLQNYKQLIAGLIEEFSVSPSEWNNLRMLCFELEAPKSAPNIAFNGSGCENVLIEAFGIQAAATNNPLTLIRLLGSEAEGAFVFEGIKTITTMWHDIYTFAIVFTDSEALQKEDIAKRESAILYSE